MGATACCTIQESKPEILQSLTPKQARYSTHRASSSADPATIPLPVTPIASRARSGPTTFQLRLDAAASLDAPTTSMAVSVTSSLGMSLHPPMNVDLAVDTLGTLKREIQDRTGIAPNQQTLAFGTKRCTSLSDDIVLGSFFFEEPANRVTRNSVRKMSTVGELPVITPNSRTHSLRLHSLSPLSSPSGSAQNSPSSLAVSPQRCRKPSSHPTSPNGQRPPGLGSCSPCITPTSANPFGLSILSSDSTNSHMATMSLRGDACMPLSLSWSETRSDRMTTWTFEELEGAWHHNPTGMHISPDRGVQVDGSEYGLPPETIEINREKRLGSGSGGSVFLGHHKPTGMQMAVKTLRVCDKAKRDQMLKEIRALILATGSEYLIQFYAGFVGHDPSVVNIVIEFMDRGSLADLRDSLGGKGAPSSSLLCISSQILRGLHHLQTRKLLHRDIKPENILHNRNGRIKLTDFGLSKDVGSVSEGGVGSTFVGTATYMSPERVSGDDYSFQSDVWSAGMVIYELATGQFPFSGTSFIDLCDCICEGPPLRLEEVCKDSPKDLCDLVARCLTRDRDARPNAIALLDTFACLTNQGDEEVAALAAWFVQLDQSR